MPFLLAWLWIRLLGLTGAIDAPRGPVLPEALPLEGWRIAALVSAPLVLALAWLGPRRVLVSGLRLPATVSAGGAAAALGLVINVLAAVVWVFNPLAAALLVPAAHAWLFATAPGTSTSGRVRVRARADRARAAGADGASTTRSRSTSGRSTSPGSRS